MQKHYAITSPDIDAPAMILTIADINTTTVAQELAKAGLPSSLEVVEITPEQLPTLFRGAWKIKNSKVEIDLPKARQEKLKEIQDVIKVRLKELDEKYQKAEDDNDNSAKSAIKSLRKSIRDLPETIDLSTFETPELLAHYLPSVLSQEV